MSTTPAARSLAALAEAVEDARHYVRQAAEAADRAALDLGDAPGSHQCLYDAVDYVAEVAAQVDDARDTLAEAERWTRSAVRDLAKAEDAAEGADS